MTTSAKTITPRKKVTKSATKRTPKKVTAKRKSKKTKQFNLPSIRLIVGFILFLLLVGTIITTLFVVFFSVPIVQAGENGGYAIINHVDTKPHPTEVIPEVVVGNLSIITPLILQCSDGFSLHNGK